MKHTKQTQERSSKCSTHQKTQKFLLKTPKKPKMKKASAIAAALVVMAMTMVFMAEPGHAITCTDVDLALRSCVEYLKGSVPQPPVACCNGAKSIQASAQTKADRQFACQCVKRAADALAGLNEDAAKNLPTRCGVELNVPISRNVNCNNIN